MSQFRHALIDGQTASQCKDVDSNQERIEIEHLSCPNDAGRPQDAHCASCQRATVRIQYRPKSEWTASASITELPVKNAARYLHAAIAMLAMIAELL
jgi:hypothetical protein